MKYVLKLLAYLLSGRVVVLLDCYDKRYLTISFASPWGFRYCYVNLWLKIGYCILQDDVLVKPDNTSPLLRNWKYVSWSFIDDLPPNDNR